jgi:hypothetical protein
MNIPFLFCAFITTVSAVISLGFSVAEASILQTKSATRRYTPAREV